MPTDRSLLLQNICDTTENPTYGLIGYWRLKKLLRIDAKRFLINLVTLPPAIALSPAAQSHTRPHCSNHPATQAVDNG